MGDPSLPRLNPIGTLVSAMYQGLLGCRVPPNNGHLPERTVLYYLMWPLNKRKV